MSAIAGRVLILPKGDYDASTVYEFLDLVNHNSSSWLAKKASQGVEPSDENAEFWQKFGSSVTPDGVTIVIDENGVISAVGGTADKVTYENESIADVTNVKEALDGIFNGTQQVGDSAKLGGKSAEEWEEEIDNTLSKSEILLTQGGWYRIAEHLSSIEGNLEYVSKGVLADSCDIIIKRTMTSIGNESYRIKYSAVYEKHEFSSTGISDVQLVKKIRHVYDSEKRYLEIYIDTAEQISEYLMVFITNGQDRRGGWKAIEPILTEETVDGVTVTTTYDIPANATPLTTANRPTGTYTGNGSATSREISTGGIGHVLFVWSEEGNAVIMPTGGYYCNTSTGALQRLKSTEAKFANGTLILASTNTVINKNGMTVEYQVG